MSLLDDLLKQAQQQLANAQAATVQAVAAAPAPAPAPAPTPTQKDFDADSGGADMPTNAYHVPTSSLPPTTPAVQLYDTTGSGFNLGRILSIHEMLMGGTQEQDGTVTVYTDEFRRDYLYPVDPRAMGTLMEGWAIANLACYAKYMQDNPDHIQDVGARLRHGLAVPRFEGAQGGTAGSLNYIGRDWDWETLGKEDIG